MKINYLKIFLCLWLFLIILAFPVMAQQKEFTGVVNDKSGKPVSNALITIKEQPELKVFTNAEGNFRVSAQPGQFLEVTTRDNYRVSVRLDEGHMVLTIDADNQMILTGLGLERSRGGMTSPFATIGSEEISRSSVMNPANALTGRLSGLTVLQGGGSGFYNSPELYIRGIETFSVGGVENSKILVLVDGFERPYLHLSVAEIESVTVLKEAGQLAMYGLRGANGVLLVTTKRGSGRDLSVNVNYERGTQQAFRLPQMLDAHGYAQAYNQARINDGMEPLYSQAELTRFQDGSSPYLYPNVDWLKEGFRDLRNYQSFQCFFPAAGRQDQVLWRHKCI
jgi:TonB-dependent SusC/RagA subfamily outer membrane receptor